MRYFVITSGLERHQYHRIWPGTRVQKSPFKHLWIYIFDSWTWVYTTTCVVWRLQTRHWNMMKIGEGCYLRDSWDGFPSHVRWSIIIQWVVGRLVVFHWTTMVSEQAENDITRLYPWYHQVISMIIHQVISIVYCVHDPPVSSNMTCWKIHGVSTVRPGEPGGFLRHGGTTIAGRFIKETHIEMGDFGVSPFRKPPHRFLEKPLFDIGLIITYN